MKKTWVQPSTRQTLFKNAPENWRQKYLVIQEISRQAPAKFNIFYQCGLSRPWTERKSEIETYKDGISELAIFKISF